MPIYFLIRVASILIALAVVSQTPNNKTWMSIVYSLGFAHYLMSLVYSRRQFVELAQQQNILIPILSAVALGMGLYAANFSLLYYFGLHHALNEAYIVNSTLRRDDANIRAFRGSVVLLHLFLYLFLLHHTVGSNSAGMDRLPTAALELINNRDTLRTNLFLGGLAVSYVTFFYYLYRIRSLLNRVTLIENCAFELLGLAAVVVSFYVQFRFLHLVFYHFVLWTLFPLPKMYARGSKHLLSYIALTVVSLIGFLFVSPLGAFSTTVSTATFYNHFAFWSFIHITTSFMLSNTHPQWIVGLFRQNVMDRTATQQI